MAKGTLGINPLEDIAGKLGAECFLCGKAITGEAHWFGKKGDLMPKLPCHLNCARSTTIDRVVVAYETIIADLAEVPRKH